MKHIKAKFMNQIRSQKIDFLVKSSLVLGMLYFFANSASLTHAIQ